MARRRRLSIPDIPYHVYQRAVDGRTCFYDDRDRRTYLRYLSEATVEHACLIHAYVLMSNHVHFLLTPKTTIAMPEMMKALSGRYAQYFNRRNERSGPLWQGRYHSVPVQSDSYFLTCQRYVELNPVRGHIVDHPSAYRWSSYPGNSGGVKDSILTPHVLYLQLGNTIERRHLAYEKFIQQALPQEASQIYAATLAAKPIGSQEFRESFDRTMGSDPGV